MAKDELFVPPVVRAEMAALCTELPLIEDRLRRAG